jgi:hypothetical protein
MSELRLTGRKRGSDSLSWDEIAAIPGAVADLSNIAKGAVGEAIPVAAVVDLAAPARDAAFCTVVAADDSYTASIPIADLRDGGWLVFRLDGRPLPTDKGGPLRLTVARGKTLCWNVKDVAELRFTAAKEPDSVPARPTH